MNGYGNTYTNPTAIPDTRYERMMERLGRAYIKDLERENAELKAQVKFWQKLYFATIGMLLTVLAGIAGVKLGVV